MISVEQMFKSFDSGQEKVQAVRDVSFEVAQGEMVTLLGPSGCGKTTTLRCVAGLERPQRGRIRFGGLTVVDAEKSLFLPPHQRHIGMVFQSYAIWPHMTVFQNVAYALEGMSLSRIEMRHRTEAALEMVQLGHLAGRPAPRLSGGQQQRVAIARALVARPEVLLFDEPLSNLDAQLRLEMRTEVRKLQQRTGVASIYVTHDQGEALAISDWIVVMLDGRIVEKGRPTEIYRRPQHLFTAQFIGATNLIPGHIQAVDSATGRVFVTTALGQITGVGTGAKLATGAAVQCSIRPEDLAIVDRTGGGTLNRLHGRLEIATFMGSAVNADLRCSGLRITCLLGRDTHLAQDVELCIGFSPENCVVLPDPAVASDPASLNAANVEPARKAAGVGA